MMISIPKISVVMPAFNAAEFLDEAVCSILDQTFRDFEFIIINDGSTDNTGRILDKYAKIDNRVKVFQQANEGMISALNRGCRVARGKYIARMDADDVSFPDRLEKQVKYMEKHPQIGILGTRICNIYKIGMTTGIWRPSTNSKMLKWTHFFGVCVCHPSVLMRRDVIEKLNFYSSDATYGEDVDLWLRASTITDFGNVPELLCKYRIWSGSSSQAASQLRRPVHARLLASYIKEFLRIEPCMEAVEGLRQTRVGPPFESFRQIRVTAHLLQRLYLTFVKENALTLNERKEISWDAAKKMATLALQASRFSNLGFLSLLVKALRLDLRLLYPSAMMRGLERAFVKK
jgi:GT2 family glycosyltransferase